MTSFCIWPLIIIVIVVFLISTEDKSQNCVFQRCSNRSPDLLPTDTHRHIVDKLITTVRLNHNLVNWRLAMLVSLLVTVIILLIFGHQASPLCFKSPTEFPQGFTVLVIATIIFITVYFLFNGIQAHQWAQDDHKIEEQLLQLRHRL